MLVKREITLKFKQTLQNIKVVTNKVYFIKALRCVLSTNSNDIKLIKCSKAQKLKNSNISLNSSIQPPESKNKTHFETKTKPVPFHSNSTVQIKATKFRNVTVPLVVIRLQQKRSKKKEEAHVCLLLSTRQTEYHRIVPVSKIPFIYGLIMLSNP